MLQWKNKCKHIAVRTEKTTDFISDVTLDIRPTLCQCKVKWAEGSQRTSTWKTCSVCELPVKKEYNQHKINKNYWVGSLQQTNLFGGSKWPFLSRGQDVAKWSLNLVSKGYFQYFSISSCLKQEGTLELLHRKWDVWASMNPVLQDFFHDMCSEVAVIWSSKMLWRNNSCSETPRCSNSVVDHVLKVYPNTVSESWESKGTCTPPQYHLPPRKIRP